MFTRIALLFGIFTTMGVGGFVAAHMKMHPGQGHHPGTANDHPIAVALEARNDLGLTQAQIAKLETLKAAMAKEMEPAHAKMQGIHQRAMKAHGDSDQKAMADVEKEIKALEATIKPVFHRYAEEAIKVLNKEQHEKLAEMMHKRMADKGSRDFGLMYMMEVREQLGITPQQFTKLQYLQADFIREFAPLREELETIHMDLMREGKQPTKEIIEKATALQSRVKELQMEFTHRAMKEVLNPEQGRKLAELLHGGGNDKG